MKKRYTEEQIIGFLREADAGLPVKWMTPTPSPDIATSEHAGAVPRCHRGALVSRYGLRIEQAGRGAARQLAGLKAGGSYCARMIIDDVASELDATRRFRTKNHRIGDARRRDADSSGRRAGSPSGFGLKPCGHAAPGAQVQE